MTPEREREIRERTADLLAGATTPVRPAGVEQLGRDLSDLLAYVDQLHEALKHACGLLLSPSEDFDEADGEWAWNTRAAILSSPLTHEQAATLRAEGAELRREIERHTEPMKRGPFGPSQSEPGACVCGHQLRDHHGFMGVCSIETCPCNYGRASTIEPP